MARPVSHLRLNSGLSTPQELSKPQTRAIHYIGTIASVVVLIWAVATQSWWWLLAACRSAATPSPGARISSSRRTSPPRSRAPVWSLVSDYRMCGLFLTGRLGNELMKYQIRR